MLALKTIPSTRHSNDLIELYLQFLHGYLKSVDFIVSFSVVKMIEPYKKKKRSHCRILFNMLMLFSAKRFSLPKARKYEQN